MAKRSTTRMSTSVFKSYRERKEFLKHRYGSRVVKVIKDILTDAEKYDSYISVTNIDKFVRQFCFEELPDDIDIASFLRGPDFILTSKGWRNKYEGRFIWYKGVYWEVIKDIVHTRKRAQNGAEYVIANQCGARLYVTRSDLKQRGANKWLTN